MNIAVIGAGIAGLTCAYELQKMGHHVEVFEKESYVGGRMSTRTKRGFPMDIGANHLANVYTHMRGYAEEFGIPWKPVEFLNYNIIHRDHEDDIDMSHAAPLLKDLSLRTKRKLAWRSLLDTRKRTDFFNLSTAAKFDTGNAKEYALKKLTKEAHDYLVDPFVSVYQFHRADEISLGIVYAMMRSHYKNKKEWDLHHLDGGMIALPQALADRLTVHTSTPVDWVKRGKNSAKISVNGEEYAFDVVIIATTADIAHSIYKNPTKTEAELLKKTEYAATVGVGFEIPVDLLGDTTIVWVPFVEGGRISGYTNEAMKGNRMIKNRKTLLLTWFHEEFAKTIIDKTDKEIFDIAKTELMKVCPYLSSKKQLKNHDLQRWPAAMPKFKQGHLKLAKKYQDQIGKTSVFLCGDYLNAPWTEGALRNGQAVAALIDRSTKSSSLAASFPV